MVKFFVMTEIAFSIIFIFMSWLFVGIFGLIGIAMAYAINYCLHLACMAFLVLHELRNMERLSDQSQVTFL